MKSLPSPRAFFKRGIIILVLGICLSSGPVLGGTFTQRADSLLRFLAETDIEETVAWAARTWPIGQGDPHKYLLPEILARLHFDPHDAGAWEAYRFLIEVDKAKSGGDRGMYHFAMPGKARLYFGFGDSMPADVRQWMEFNEGGHLHLYRAGGTENHQTQSRLSGYLFAEAFQEDPQYWTEDHEQFLYDWAVQEVRKLFRIGMGEWDSSTYVSFTVGSWANLFEFARRDDLRLIARAALDWYSTAYSIKYFHGVQAGPENRGFARSPVSTHSDIMAWLWWGNLPPGHEIDFSSARNAVRSAALVALSSYRPPGIVDRIARKEVDLPFEVMASKPSYFGYSRDNLQHEILYADHDFFMGTLYCPTPGDIRTGRVWPQTTMHKLAVRFPNTVAVMGMSQGFHRHFPVEGRTPFDQYHQSKGTVLNLAVSGTHPSGQRSLLAVPDLFTEVYRDDTMLVWQAGQVWVVAYPISREGWGETDLTSWNNWTRGDTGGSHATFPGYSWLESRGSISGWVVDTARRSKYETLDQLQSAIRETTRLDLEKVWEEQKVEYRSLYGDTLILRHTGAPGGRPDAWTNGGRLRFAGWPVYQSRYVRQDVRSGLLYLSDGEEHLVIDFRGEVPVWRQH